MYPRNGPHSVLTTNPETSSHSLEPSETQNSQFPWWLSLQCGRPRFNPWVGKTSWRRKWQPTPVFLPGKSHGWRILVGYNPWGRKELDTTERLHFTSVSSVPCSWIEQPSLQSSPLKSRNFIPSTNFTLNRDRTRTQTQMHIFFLGQLPD